MILCYDRYNNNNLVLLFHDGFELAFICIEGVHDKNLIVVSGELNSLAASGIRKYYTSIVFRRKLFVPIYV